MNNIAYLITASLFFIYSCADNVGKENKITSSITVSDTTDKNFIHSPVDSIINTGCQPCNIPDIVVLEKNLQQLHKGVIDRFLCTFNESCKNNIEYSEYSNELLFRSFEASPLLSIISLIGISDQKKELVWQTLSDPVGDQFEIEKIIDDLKKVDVQALKSLKTDLIKKLDNDRSPSVSEEGDATNGSEPDLFKCQPCNAASLKNFDLLFTRLNEGLINEFFCTIDSRCIGNEAFTHRSNELLFRFLKKDPLAFFVFLGNTDHVSKREFIVQNFSAPINNRFETDSLIRLVEKVEVLEMESVINKTIAALEAAP